MANAIAVRMDREGLAEMSCIAGVGGGVTPLVKKAQSATSIIAVDGCPLACAKACLQREGLAPSFHFELSDFGVKKQYHKDFDPKEFEKVYPQIKEGVKGS